MPSAQRRSTRSQRPTRHTPYPAQPLREHIIRQRPGSNRPRGILKEIEWWRVQVGQLQDQDDDASNGADNESNRGAEVAEAVNVSTVEEPVIERVLPVSSLGDAFGDYPLLDETKSFLDAPSFVATTPPSSPPSSPLMSACPLTPAQRGHQRRRSAFARAASYAGLGSWSPSSTSSGSRASPDPETQLRELIDLPSRYSCLFTIVD
ncbi:hypothetical protein DACRYDRAFT_20002 [Dacryopinax primogenitus]|uniref:Uncharacterized protein n=1 Tax=Dacryopinax primogenitus (strain DJM 731) TaxID=1858805 RepID=M5GGI6_DACPD|nr:uncharacterized protein DACRYDRAFT_20002 [Dacryopinax primogenitus]EJU05553.1 hypothetical protein DACRYDRAFT_20002 [Dacryopinax primogenitus]